MPPTMAFLTSWRSRLPFSPSTTPVQAAAYLLGISLFSISFLVFLNSSISFVITDRLGQRTGVGDIVGTLGFVDECVALVACPLWGLLSDRVGVRNVAVAGYVVIAVALVGLVNVSQVGPLYAMRAVFAVGACGAATMVTAILPSLTDNSPPTFRRTTTANDNTIEAESAAAAHAVPPEDSGASSDSSETLHSRKASRNSIALSLASDATVTPERFTQSQSSSSSLSSSHALPTNTENTTKSKPSALAGLVGFFTGCGALLALVLFLPLPARFGQLDGVTLAQAVEYSYYVVAGTAALVAVGVGLGLRGIRGEEGKGWGVILRLRSTSSPVGSNGENGLPTARSARFLPYRRLLLSSLRLGLRDARIGLGYLGGFVARASTVAISLFIPLAVNAFFMRNGFCHGSPTDPSPELKKECRTAYILASILTGVAQLVGLICAPLFGYLGSKTRANGPGAVSWPLLLAAALGVAGYIAFARLPSPEIKNVDGRGGSPGVFVVVAMLGVSQIGAIVCSLGSLGNGVLAVDTEDDEFMAASAAADYSSEESPLLGAGRPRVEKEVSRVQLKGSIAGVYSWCGGAAILLLTKVGGYLFDVVDTGAPFYMMAGFNAMLFIATLGVDLMRVARERRRPIITTAIPT